MIGPLSSTKGIAALCMVSAPMVFVAGSVALAARYDAIVVTGTEFLAQEAVLASCDIQSGVDYAASDLADMESCLLSTGAFRDVSAKASGRKLVIDVVESNNRPGRVDVGLAYDSRDGVVGSLSFERYNLFPKTFGGFDLRLGAETRELETYLYRKEAFGHLDFGLDTLLRSTKYDDSGYESRRMSIEPYIAAKLGSFGRVEGAIGYRFDRMDKVDPTASPVLRSEVGDHDAAYLRLSLRYNQDFSKTTPEGRLEGLSGGVSAYIWGIDSDRKIAELRVNGEARVALTEATSLSFGAHGGLVKGLDGSVTRTTDRFSPGGAEFRGFAARGIGPRDGSWNLGGTRYFVGSVEVKRDVGDLWGTKTQVGLFTDFGSVWGADNSAINGERELRSSVGLSLTLDVGGTPVSAYLAKPTRDVAGDKSQSFGISLSHRF